MTQEELLKNVFIPLATAKDINIAQGKYIISALVEYQRSLYEADLPVEVPTQSFCIRFLADVKEFLSMQMMLQYQSFNDSLEIAQALAYTRNKGYPSALQWAIDMYHRIKRPGDVIRLLLNTEKVKEVLRYVEQVKVKGVSVIHILEVVKRLPEVDKEKYLRYFIKVSVLFIG